MFHPLESGETLYCSHQENRAEEVPCKFLGPDLKRMAASTSSLLEHLLLEPLCRKSDYPRVTMMWKSKPRGRILDGVKREKETERGQGTSKCQ